MAALSTKSKSPAKPSRYVMEPGAVRSSEGGLVGIGNIGTGDNAIPFLVHQFSRTVEAISAKAAAEGIAHGAIPADDLVEVYAEVGKLDVIARAVAIAIRESGRGALMDAVRAELEREPEPEPPAGDPEPGETGAQAEPAEPRKRR